MCAKARCIFRAHAGRSYEVRGGWRIIVRFKKLHVRRCDGLHQPFRLSSEDLSSLGLPNRVLAKVKVPALL